MLSRFENEKSVIAADPELAPCILISPVVNLGKVYGLVLRFSNFFHAHLN